MTYGLYSTFIFPVKGAGVTVQVAGRGERKGERISGFQNLSLFESRVIDGFEFFTLNFVGRQEE